MAIDDFLSRNDRRRVVALTTNDNPASLRAIEKLRMRRRGETDNEWDKTTYVLFARTSAAEDLTQTSLRRL